MLRLIFRNLPYSTSSLIPPKWVFSIQMPPVQYVKIKPPWSIGLSTNHHFLVGRVYHHPKGVSPFFFKWWAPTTPWEGFFLTKFPEDSQVGRGTSRGHGPRNNWRGWLGLPGATATVPTYLLDYIYVYFLYPLMWPSRFYTENERDDPIYFFCLGGAD